MKSFLEAENALIAAKKGHEAIAVKLQLDELNPGEQAPAPSPSVRSPSGENFLSTLTFQIPLQAVMPLSALMGIRERNGLPKHEIYG